MDKTEIFTRNLKKRMYDKGVIQADIVRDLNLSKGSFSLWYNGKSYPKLANIKKIATYLGCTIQDLTGIAPQVTVNADGGIEERIHNDVLVVSPKNEELLERLKFIVNLLRDGLISKDEYERLKDEIFR